MTTTRIAPDGNYLGPGAAAAQRRAAPQTLKEPRFGGEDQKKFAGAVVGRVDIPARGESSTFFNVTRSQISEHYITRTGIPLNVPVHPPPVLRWSSSTLLQA